LLVVMLGPPGSGKGTQAKKLSEKVGMRHISTGDVLRDAIARGTELGKKAERYVHRGSLVPDDLMLGLIAESMDRGRNGQGLVLDGFPRTERQAEGLDKMLRERGSAVDRAVLIRVRERKIIERLSARRVCPKCGRNYNLVSLPPEKDTLCDECGVELEQRVDDSEETVLKRLEVYDRETKPIVEFYRRREILLEVDGEGTVEETFSRITQGLGLS